MEEWLPCTHPRASGAFSDDDKFVNSDLSEMVIWKYKLEARLEAVLRAVEEEIWREVFGKLDKSRESRKQVLEVGEILPITEDPTLSLHGCGLEAQLC